MHPPNCALCAGTGYALVVLSASAWRDALCEGEGTPERLTTFKRCPLSPVAVRS
jgi:hypothetical protein